MCFVMFYFLYFQGVEHLSWLGLFKDISSGTSLQPFWDKKALQRNADKDRNTYDKYIRMR